MMNIKFSYLYRDAGNYKAYGEVIFDNPDGIAVEELELILRSKLIDGQWFYARGWNLPDLHFEKWDEDLDHGFHEFEGICYTDEKANTVQGILEFYQLVKKAGWK